MRAICDTDGSATAGIDESVDEDVDTTTPGPVDLDTLLDEATSMFKLVAIDLDDNDAQVIFEASR